MKRFSVFGLCLLFGLPVWGGAQVLAPLSAVQLALENNYGIQLAELDVQRAELNNTWGAAGKWPALTLILSQTNNLQDVDNPASVFGKALITSIGGTAGLQLDWRLFGGFAVRANKLRFEQLQQQSRGNVKLLIQNTVQAVLVAYQDALLAQELVELYAQNVEVSTDRLQYERTARDLGSGSSFNILQAEQNALADATLLRQQRNAVEDAKRQLNELMGRAPRTPFQLTGELAVDTPRYLLDTLRGALLTRNVDFRQQTLNIQLQKTALKQAKAARSPTIDFSLGANTVPNYGRLDGTDGFDRSGFGNTFNYYANFTLNFNLYNGGATRRAIEIAELDIAAAELSTDQLKLQLERQLVDALAQYETQKAIYRLASNAADAAQQLLRLAEERLRTGIINSFDFRDVQLQVLQAEFNRKQAAYSIRLAQLELLRLTGGILSR